MPKMTYAIDFGTTNSLLGAAEGDKIYPPIRLDPTATDPTILRSVLFFPNANQCFYGSEAIREFVKHDMEGRFVRSVKKFLPLRSFSGTQIGNRTLSLETIIGTFLTEMRRRANAHFGREVDSVVLGRPAKFSANEEEDKLAQSRLEQAARLAGFKEIRFCPEPIAAAYGFKSTLAEPKVVLVADFGGGTSDFTVIKISRADYSPSDVLSIGGLSVAGDALDGALMRKKISRHFGADVQYRAPFGSNVLTMPPNLMEKICSPADISLLRERDTQEFFRNVQNWSLGEGDKKKMDQLFSLINEQIGFELFEEIERTKRALSGKDSETFRFRHSGLDLREEISRDAFEEFTRERVNRILDSLDQTIKEAGISADGIDIVCSTGGTAKVSALQAGLEARFGAEKIQQHNHFHSIVHGLTQMAREK